MSFFAFQSYKSAETFREFFDINLIDAFKAFFDKEYLSSIEGEGFDDAETAGKTDAIKSPPLPLHKSQECEGYLASVFSNANNFFNQYVQCFYDFIMDQIKDLDEKVAERRSDSVLSSEEELKESKLKYDQAVKDLSVREELLRDKYLTESDGKLNWAKQTSKMSMFTSLFFISTLEFALVWYVLKENLGVSSAIFASVVAVLVIIILAGMAAYSLARTSKDLDKRSNYIGFFFFTMVVVFFIIALIVLTNYRADTTGFNFSSFTSTLLEIDLFLVTILNLACFIFAVDKIRRFIKPKFWTHQDFLQAVDIAKMDLAEKKISYNTEVKEFREKFESDILKIQGLTIDLKNIQSDYNVRIQESSLMLERFVKNEFIDNYKQSNFKYRTEVAFPTPEWLKSITFKVDSPNVQSQVQVDLIKSKLAKSVSDAEKFLLTAKDDFEEIYASMQKEGRDLFITSTGVN